MVLFSAWFISAGLPEPQELQMMEHIEKLIMTRLHKWVFCHDSVDDEQKDLALQKRIRSGCTSCWLISPRHHTTVY